jgi:hypothetical protein
MKLPLLSVLFLVPSLAFGADVDRIGAGIDALNHPTRAASCANLVDSIADALKRQRADEDTVAAAMRAMQDARSSRRPLSASESALLAKADALVASGTQIPPVWQPICCSGFREHQTNLSLADPGPGHRDIILSPENGDLLDGLFVHNEYIDRESLAVAPYRYISPATNRMLVMRAAGNAPVTAFVGQPNFQAGGFDNDKITPVHDTAGDASAVFAAGTADAKVTMDGLTARQAIELMQGVKGAVVRKPGQFLSAAFNITKPLVDDRAETLAANGGKPVTISDPAKIASVGAQLAKAGGWDKIAWDGASEEIPSRPLVDHPDDTVRGRLTLAQLTEVTHEAHSLGLETYISAGMRDRHMALAAYAGVDGVGIGTSLHKRITQPDGSLKLGDLDPALIRETLAVRNQAEASIKGQGAKALAQLDSAFAKGTLTPPQTERREKIYAALLAGDEAALQKLLSGTVASR